LRSPTQELAQITSRITGTPGATAPPPPETGAAGAAATLAKAVAANATAAVDFFPGLGRKRWRLPVNCPLFPQPAELAVGLALKELR
jgi:hypothetical protein